MEGKVGYKVAVLVDFSPNAKKAVERAVQLAAASAGELVLVHCMHGEPFSWSFPKFHQFERNVTVPFRV